MQSLIEQGIVQIAEMLSSHLALYCLSKIHPQITSTELSPFRIAPAKARVVLGARSLVEMVSEHTIKLCQENSTVSSEFAKNPEEAPTEIIKRLYGRHKSSTTHDYSKNVERPLATVEDLERARRCGKWGPAEPSELFLRIYHDALSCLDADPLGGMVSPPLMGSYGTIPLTIIAPLAEIFRHMANLIVRAEKEVVLMTCSWSPSLASRLISDALRELSSRAGRRGGRASVKIMYDRAGPSNFMDSRQPVKPEVYSGYVHASIPDS